MPDLKDKKAYHSTLKLLKDSTNLNLLVTDFKYQFEEGEQKFYLYYLQRNKKLIHFIGEIRKTWTNTNTYSSSGYYYDFFGQPKDDYDLVNMKNFLALALSKQTLVGQLKAFAINRLQQLETLNFNQPKTQPTYQSSEEEPLIIDVL